MIDSPVSCIPLSRTPQCSAFSRVFNVVFLLSFMCHLISLTPQCSSHRRVSSLSIVCTDCKLYDCYFSVWPKDIIMKIILKVTNCPRNLFYFRRFCSTQGSLVTLISQKAQRCASHPGVKLDSVHHTAKSSFAVCIIPWSQTPWCASHRRDMKKSI